MQSGKRVRITARLLHAPTDKHLWAESYERDLHDVLELQGEVAKAIADQIRITLTPQEQAGLVTKRPVSPEVFQLYLKGQYFSNQGSPEEARKGIGYFEQAIAKDAGYAPAHAGMGMAFAGLANVVSPPHEVMPKALAEANKALELDDGLSQAHTALANVRMFYQWDWDGAEKEIKRAIELNPSSAEAHQLYGMYFRALGQPEKAVVELQRASDLDPLSLAIKGGLLWTYLGARQYDRTIEAAQKALSGNPKFVDALMAAGLAHAQKKQFPEALASLEKARSLAPNFVMDHFVAIVQAAAGNKTEARRLLARMEETARREYVCAYEMASVHVALGDNDAALKWMQRGVKEQCDCLVWLKVEPWVDPLRVDPRYMDLMQRVFKGR